MSYDDQALQALIGKFKGVLSAEGQRAILTEVGRAMGVAAEAAIPPYPPPRRAPYPFMSEKQRRFVRLSALYRAGKITRWGGKTPPITFPYRRTGQLGQSITSAVEDASEQVVVVKVGTNRPGAGWVIGDEQAQYHKGHWWQLRTVIEEARGDILAAGRSAFVKALRERLR